MNVALVDKMGSDLTVVNAARVSYAKELNDPINRTTPGVIKEKDEKLTASF